MPELRNEISFTGADLCAGSIEVPCSGCQTQITITPLANLFEKFEGGAKRSSVLPAKQISSFQSGFWSP